MYFNRKIEDLLPFSSGASSFSAGMFLSKLSSLCSWNWKKERAERSCWVKEIGGSLECPSLSAEPLGASSSISGGLRRAGVSWDGEFLGKSSWELGSASCIHQLLPFSPVLQNIPGELDPWVLPCSPGNEGSASARRMGWESFSQDSW